MPPINIINRELTPQEMEQVNAGFDALYLSEGVASESTARISFVALKEDRLVGCSSGLAHKNGATYSGRFYLTDLYIDKAFRNQGIGADLLKALEDKTKTVGVQNISLDIRPGYPKILQQTQLHPIRGNGKLVFRWQQPNRIKENNN